MDLMENSKNRKFICSSVLFQKVHHFRQIETTAVTTLKCALNENSVAI